jgi:Tfp pilus assembly protein PilN
MRAVNLLTPELRSASSGKGSSGPSALEAPGGIGAFILLGALALCVAALAGLVVSNNVVKDRKAELAQVKAKSAATVAQASKLKPYADFQTLAQARAGTVQALASARFDWEQALRDLSRAMPKEVYLSSLDGSISGGSTIRGAINSPAIELKGCTKSQPAVAGLMSRMRNVQGVTRVSLAKSDKDTGAAGAVGTGTVNPCGKGAPPSFEIVIFFERSTVAQTLTGVTGAVDPAAPAAAAPSAEGKTPATSQPKSESTPAPTTPPTAAVTGGAK